jgi:hypothetical protein
MIVSSVITNNYRSLFKFLKKKKFKLTFKIIIFSIYNIFKLSFNNLKLFYNKIYSSNKKWILF